MVCVQWTETAVCVERGLAEHVDCCTADSVPSLRNQCVETVDVEDWVGRGSSVQDTMAQEWLKSSINDIEKQFIFPRET